MEKQGYYVYYTTMSSFSPEEKKALQELLGRDFFRKEEDNDLSDEQVQRILSRVKPAMKKWLNTKELLPFLKRHHVLTDSEMQLLKSSTLMLREQAIRLTEFMMNKGSYGIAALYLSLLDSSEQVDGLPAHYQLAGELKQTVHSECGVGSDEHTEGIGSMAVNSAIDLSTRQSLQVCLKKLRGISLPRATALALIGNLGLSQDDIHTLPSSLERICSIWISKETNPFIDDLIQALILTKSTGRYASLISSSKEKSESPAVRNFFLTLGEQWESVARYLGYIKEELEDIVRKFPDSIENQVAEFLELWELPGTGQLSLPLLHKLKTVSGVTSEQKPSRRLADRTDVPSYVYMNKRLKTDAAGIPHRSLDSYQPYSTRAQALKAPYDSFTSYESTAPLASTPPKPPRSYSSSGNQPRGSFNAGTSQHQRDTDFNGSKSLNYSSSTGSRGDNKNMSSFHIKVTGPQEPRRTPPTPPSRPGPNSSPSSGSYGLNGSEFSQASHSHYSTNEPQTKFVVMLFTGVGAGGNANQNYGNSSRTQYGPMDHNDDPVIEELPDDVPMEIIDNKSGDGSPPPLSDGRASPPLDLGNISEPEDRNDLNDFGDQLNHAHVLSDLDGLSKHDDLNELNDLNAITPPYTNSPAPTPDHINNALDLPTKPSTPALTSQRVTTVDTTGSLPQEHSTPVVTSLRLKSSHLNGSDTHSSTYPPSTVTGGDHDAMARSEVSSSVAGQPVAPQPHTMATEPITAASGDRVGMNIKEIPTEPKDVQISIHEKPRSLEANNNDGEKVLAEGVTSPRPQIEAPDRRYHSRARLDSLEDRNNLDTDSELQSFSESEKESDTEDYPGMRTSRRRMKHSSAHERSLSISSSEDEDPFPEERNDLSMVSSPEHELPPGDESGGGFGVSLSGGVPAANLRDQREDVSANDLSTRNASRSSLPLPQPMTRESTDKLTSDQGQRKSSLHVDGGLCLDLVLTAAEQGHDNIPADGQAGLQDGIQNVLGENGVGTAGRIPQGKSGQLKSLLSGKERKPELNQDETVENSSVGQSLCYPLTVPKPPDDDHSLQLVSQSEENLLRTEPKVQVTRTSDQVIEPASHSTSSSDQLQPPVRKSFSSLPTTYNTPSLDGDYCLKVADLEMPTSTSAPSTGLHMMLDQPPPPFTHYAAPPPIFTAHVFEQSADHVFSSGSVEERDVQDDNNQSEGEGKDSGMDTGGGEWLHSGAGMGMDYLTRQNQDVSLSSLSVHPPLDERSTGSKSLLVNSLDNPTEASSLQSAERDHVAKQPGEPPTEFLSQDIMLALEDPDGAEVLLALLESGANINLPTRDGEYAVHIAVRVEKGLEKLKLLLHHNANRNVARSSDLKTPLHLACLRQDLEMAQLLLEGTDAHPCPQDSQGFTPLHFKQTLENVEITRCLINRGAPVDIPCKVGFLTPLLVCCVVGNSTYDSACLLVQSDASVNGAHQASNKPLIAASGAGYEAMVQLLLDKGADINIMDQDHSTALLKACQNKQVSVAKRLCLRNYVDFNAPNKEGVTPLMAAVANDVRDLVVVLLQNGAYHDVSRVARFSLPGGQVTEFEITPVADAAVRGFLEIIQILVDYGAQINAINPHALPPITGAILAGQAHVVEYFAKQNDLDCTLEGLMQPFTVAVKSGNQLCAELLVERYPGGIDVMLRAATDQGLEELVQCIESFQQKSVEHSTEQPQVFLLPDQLPWDNKAHLHTEGVPLLATGHNDDGQVNDLDLNDTRVVEQEQREYNPNDHTNQALNIQNRRSLLSSPVPQDTANVDQSSLYSGGSASLAATSHVEETRSPSPRSQLPHESGNQRLGAGGRVTVPSEDHESWNQFSDGDDDSGDESGSAVQVLHVDDPRLAFGQSVYVGRQDHSDGSSQTQSLRPPSQNDVVNVQGQNTQSGSGNPSFSQPLSGNVAVVPVTYHLTALQHPDSSSQGQINQGDVSAGALSLLPPSAFAPTAGTTTQSTATTAPISSSFNLAQAVPPPFNSQQPPPPPPPSSVQSLPISMSTGQSSQTLQSGFSLGGNSDTVMSSLGFSPSGPPLRARATDVEGESVNSNPSSGLSDNDRRLFAPRPKSPPPIESPRMPVSATPVNLKTPTSMTANVVEVLHEFAQITISAAVGKHSQEVLIDRAMGSGFEHIANFFLNYFHSPAEFARGSNLVSEFIGGAPSPLNFLLLCDLVSKAGFVQVLTEIGRTDFVGQLMMALHQFPGSDNLPWSEEDMLTSLFNRTFSIGSLHPSMESSLSLSMTSSSMGGASDQAMVNETAGVTSHTTPHMEPQRPDSPPPPKPFSAPTAQKQHTFPESGGHRLGHDSTDLAKVNNPRNLVTPKVTPPPKSTPTTTPNATPTSAGTPTVTPPRKLSSSSIVSTTSSLPISRPQLQERDYYPDMKQKLDVASLSSSGAASHESLNSTTSSGQQSKQSMHVVGSKWGNGVDKPIPGGGEEHGQMVQNHFGNEIGTSEAQSDQTSIHTNETPVGGVAPTVAAASVGNQKQIRYGNEVEVTPSSIPLTDVVNFNCGDKLNDLDECDRITEERLRFPLKPAGDAELHAVPSDIDESTQSAAGGESMLDNQQMEKVMEEPPSDVSDWGAGLSMSPSPSKQDEQAHSAEENEEGWNDLDSEDEVPGGHAFDVIDNIADGMTECPPPTSQPSSAPATDSDLQAEPTATPHPSSGVPAPLPTQGFMHLLDSMQSKSAIPGSLKSTYGVAGVEELEVLEEPRTESVTPVPGVDLVKHTKSDFVQPLLVTTNEPTKSGQKQLSVDESFPAVGERSSVEFGLGDSVSSFTYDHTKAKKPEFADPFMPHSFNTNTKYADMSMSKLPTPNSSPLEPPAYRGSKPARSVGNENTNREVSFGEEDTLMSTQHYSSEKSTKIQPVGGVPLSSTSSNRNITLVDMVNEGKGHSELDDEKAYKGMTSDISLVKQQSLSHRFKAGCKHFSDPIHHKELLHMPALVKPTNVSELDLPQSQHQDEHNLAKEHSQLPVPDVAVLDGSEGSQQPISHTAAQLLVAADPQPYDSKPSQELPLTMNLRTPGIIQPAKAVVTMSRTVTQGTDGKQLDKSLLPVSLKVQRLPEESDSTDTETDEEIRGSVTPSYWRRCKDVDPMLSVEKDDIKWTTSPTSGMMEFSTSGAWDEKRKEASKALRRMEKGVTSKESPQKMEMVMTLRQAAKVEHVKRTELAHKEHSRVAAKEAETSLTHHTPLVAAASPPTSAARPKPSSSGIKKSPPVNKRIPMDRKSSAHSSARSPRQTKKPGSTSKRVPPSIASAGPKTTAAKPSTREPVADMHSGKKQLLQHHPSKTSVNSSSSKHSLRKVQVRKKADVSASKAAMHEKVVKMKAGFPLAMPKIDKDSLVSTDEEHENKEKPQSDNSVDTVLHHESDRSSTTVGSVTSLMLMASAHYMRISLPDIANNSEQIFGIQIPNVVISGDEEDELFETIARRVTKWKMLGRYLGLDDGVLNEIEIHNHFVGERCLKMLKRFKSDSGDGATYVKLAVGLKDTMHDSLVTDISKYFPQYDQPSQAASDSGCTIAVTLDFKEMDDHLNKIKQSFEHQRNNGKQKALLQITYPPGLANSRANIPLCFELHPLNVDSVRVIEDVCIAAAVRKVEQLSVNIRYT